LLVCAQASTQGGKAGDDGHDGECDDDDEIEIPESLEEVLDYLLTSLKSRCANNDYTSTPNYVKTRNTNQFKKYKKT
jgi:hypothetical protein